MKIEVHSNAHWDLVEGATFYEKQSASLAVYFLDCLEADIDRLTTLAGIHERVYGYHRMLSRKFPFAIFYVVDGEVATVYAVLDSRQDPEVTRRRLSR